jgi:glycosyltransferase involved in cell wall biosynthesis
VGEIGDDQKDEFLGNAYALLFPIEWPEPFGLVLIEAMACGTPVIAYRRGSVPEVIEDGVTGFMVEGIDEAVEAARRVADIDRRRCREEFERRFTARRMAEDYLEVYQRLRQPDGAMVS